MSAPRRGDVYVVALAPTRGKEIRKTRSCVVVSPDELNRQLGTYVVAPMTTGGHPYPFRVACRFKKRDGFVVLDQLRTIDGARMVRRVGRLTAPTLSRALGVLREMFAE